ncbi:putative ribonuclease H-like domain-containing protein [Tanacetum coccineum]
MHTCINISRHLKSASTRIFVSPDVNHVRNPNGSNLLQQDLEQIHEDDLEVMDLKWQLSLLSMRAKRECRAPRNKKGQFKYQDNTRKQGNNEDISSKVMLAIDGVGFDLSDMAKEQVQTNMALMMFSDSEVRVVLSNLKNHEKPVKKSVRYAEMYRSQSPRGNQRNWNEQKSNQLGSDFVMYNKACFICGSFNHVQAHCKYHQRERMVYENNYNRVNYNYTTNMTHPNAQRNMVPRTVLMKTDLKPFNTARTVNTAHPKSTVSSAKTMAYVLRPRLLGLEATKTCSASITFRRNTSTLMHEADQVLGCSRHMIGNIAYLLDFKEFDGGYVTFRRGAHGGMFDDKSDEGFFVGYSLSSKAFRVYNTRTRRVEENLHIGFLENKPMIEGNGPKWLFDIDSLTQSMNYVPVAAGTITNESAGTQGELNAGTSTQKEEISQDCIVMPIWKDASYFDSPSKDVGNGEPKSAADDQKQVEDGPHNESDEKDNLEVNTGHFKLNTVDPSVSTDSLNDQDSPKDMFKMGASHTLEATHVEFFSDEDEPEVDLGNILNSYTVPTTPNTRIHKDHPIKNVIGDVKSSIQTRRMTKSTSEQGFLSAVWKLVDLPNGKRAIGTKWVFRNKKDERGIVIRNKARWYETLANYLLGNGFKRGKIDHTLFIKKQKEYILLVHVYVDDIIFGSTNKEMCNAFEKLMKDKFQMSSMGELTFFLGLQVTQKEDRIFISQDKYVAEILKKFNYTDVKSASTPVDLEKPLDNDEIADDVIFQVTPKTSHLLAVKRIFRYLKGKPTLGLWYSRDSPFELRWISWQFEEAKCGLPPLQRSGYVATANLLTKGFDAGRFQYLVSSQSKRGRDTKVPQSGGPLIKVGNEAVHKELGDRMERVATTVSSLEAEQESGNINKTQSMATLNEPIHTLGSGEDIMKLTELMAYCTKLSELSWLIWNYVIPTTWSLTPEGSEDFRQIVDFLNTSYIKFALTENPTIYTSLIQQFWQTASTSTLKDGEVEITTTIDGQLKTITEASLKRHLKLEDVDGISSLPNFEILSNLLLWGPIQQGEGSTVLVESHHIPITTPSTSQPLLSSPSRVPTPPHDSPLLGGHTPGSDEGSMTLNELMVLCTQLSTKVASLEQDLKHTKKGRTSADTEILLDQEEPTEQVEDLSSGEKGEKEISTANLSVSTASATPEVSTTAENLVYIRRSAEKRKDKGKTIMKEDESIQKKTKKQLEKERLGHEEAIILQEHINKEERQRIARDAEIAKQLQEEFDRARQEQEVIAEADQAHDID